MSGGGLFSFVTEAGLNAIFAGVADRLLNHALANCRDQQPDGYHMTALHHEAMRIAALAR